MAAGFEGYPNIRRVEFSQAPPSAGPTSSLKERKSQTHPSKGSTGGNPLLHGRKVLQQKLVNGIRQPNSSTKVQIKKSGVDASPATSYSTSNLPLSTSTTTTPGLTPTAPSFNQSAPSLTPITPAFTQFVPASTPITTSSSKRAQVSENVEESDVHGTKEYPGKRRKLSHDKDDAASRVPPTFMLNGEQLSASAYVISQIVKASVAQMRVAKLEQELQGLKHFAQNEQERVKTQANSDRQRLQQELQVFKHNAQEERERVKKEAEAGRRHLEQELQELREAKKCAETKAEKAKTAAADDQRQQLQKTKEHFLHVIAQKDRRVDELEQEGRERKEKDRRSAEEYEDMGGDRGWAKRDWVKQAKAYLGDLEAKNCEMSTELQKKDEVIEDLKRQLKEARKENGRATENCGFSQSTQQQQPENPALEGTRGKHQEVIPSIEVASNAAPLQANSVKQENLVTLPQCQKPVASSVMNCTVPISQLLNPPTAPKAERESVIHTAAHIQAVQPTVLDVTMDDAVEDNHSDYAGDEEHTPTSPTIDDVEGDGSSGMSECGDPVPDIPARKTRGATVSNIGPNVTRSVVNDSKPPLVEKALNQIINGPTGHNRPRQIQKSIEIPHGPRPRQHPREARNFAKVFNDLRTQATSTPRLGSPKWFQSRRYPGTRGPTSAGVSKSGSPRQHRDRQTMSRSATVQPLNTQGKPISGHGRAPNREGTNNGRRSNNHGRSDGRGGSNSRKHHGGSGNRKGPSKDGKPEKRGRADDHERSRDAEPSNDRGRRASGLDVDEDRNDEDKFRQLTDKVVTAVTKSLGGN
ncbi:MAG: hypothetical protein M1820_004846 [Bogoriella megaspora]|nr:MAG: hypothetical protein M1820_004846 [Bogoriella megaspora]